MTAPPSSPAFSARPRLTIDLNAVAANWRFYAERLAPAGAEASAVVKADGYGLGAVAVARRLQRAGCRVFWVANAEEGAALRPALGPGPRIFVLGGPTPEELGLFAPFGLSPVLNARWQVEAWAGARPEGDDRGAALHVDTGLNRLGLTAGEVEGLLAEPALLARCGVDHVMSHLACSAEPDHPMNAAQRGRFEALWAKLAPRLAGRPAGAFGLTRSLAASAGALLGPAYAYDIARIGVGLYGGAPLNTGGPDLAVSIRLEAPILQVRPLAPGDHVGYGATYEAKSPRLAGVVAAGYADGFLRAGSGRGYGVLAGRRAPILGRISMDLITLDVTEAGDAARVGALVELLGPAAGLEEPSRLAGSFAYEVLTRLGPRCVRRVIGELA